VPVHRARFRLVQFPFHLELRKRLQVLGELSSNESRALCKESRHLPRSMGRPVPALPREPCASRVGAMCTESWDPRPDLRAASSAAPDQHTELSVALVCVRIAIRSNFGDAGIVALQRVQCVTPFASRRANAERQGRMRVGNCGRGDDGLKAAVGWM